jgi:DNA polymerase elongation subunit (family B)
LTKSKPKILLLDIETAPGIAFFWNLYDDSIPLDRVIQSSRILCATFKWYGEKGETFVAEWTVGQKKMLQAVRDAMSQADAVVTYNGDKFDFKWLRGEFIAKRIKPAGHFASIDLYKLVRQCRFDSGKLEYVGPYLEIGSKTKHAGFSLWRKVLSGDAKAQRKMEAYNRKDVRLMVGLYKLRAPYMENHPSLHGQRCSGCGSAKWHKHGTRKTRAYEYDRLECQSCGHWDKGPKRKIK